ncbi:MAG: L-threonylcarbamoyladenylate synthase [Bacteroidia bacterium]|nr:L-threonylcarbamoyladenylate synthase [Bacteroidia bacterium]
MSIGQDIEQAAVILSRGHLVAIPTETVYGLAANAFNPDAVIKIFEAKNRPQFNPLIVHTDSVEKMEPFLNGFPDWADKLAQRFWPGPLTILLPRNEIIPDLVTAGMPRVAVRIPEHPLTLALLRSLDFPLAAPSANPFGYISPTTAAHVAEQLGDKVSYILDGGPAKIGIESTIIGLGASGDPEIYRLGGLSLEEIESVIGPVQIKISPVESNPESSGMLKSHYAPKTKLVHGSIDVLLASYAHRDPLLLTYKRMHPGYPSDRQLVLSPTGNIPEAAHRLFSALRELDDRGARLIIAEEVPDQGLGRAINDRLRRAAG